MKKNKCVISYLFLMLSFCSIISQNISSSDEIPIIFIHIGYRKYLKHSLWQALQYNKNIILISDEEKNKHGLDVQYYDVTPFKEEANQFATEYVHLSIIKEDIQLRRIQRWFILKEFMEHYNIPVCFHCDSDVMIYSNISNEVKKFEPFDFALVTGKAFKEDKKILQLATSPRFSDCTVLIRKEILDDYCAFLHRFYTDKENINELIHLRQLNKLPTLVGGMFLITRYMDMTDAPKKFIIKNICKIKDNTAFDSSIHKTFDEQFDKEKPPKNRVIRNIKWINNKPYSYNKILDKMISFNTLHFSGNNKRLMSSFRRKKIQ